MSFFSFVSCRNPSGTYKYNWSAEREAAAVDMNVVKFNKLRSQNNEYHCVTLEMFHYVYIYIYIGWGTHFW
jgi:hypothetical protein